MNFENQNTINSNTNYAQSNQLILPKLLPTDTVSRMEWQGCKSQQVKFKQRKHIYPRGELEDGLFAKDPPLLGKKHYPQKFGYEIDYKPSMKTFAISGKESKDQQAYDPKKLVMVLPVKKWRPAKFLQNTINKYKEQQEKMQHTQKEKRLTMKEKQQQESANQDIDSVKELDYWEVRHKKEQKDLLF